MNQDKKLALAALVAGALIGYGVRAVTETDRYILRDVPGAVGAVYKVDTKTGRMWLIHGGTESPIQQ